MHKIKMVFKTPYWEAVGIIVGMIIGSGIFALPYAVNVSGIFWAIISAALAFIAVLSIHLAYGEIVSNTDGSHRLPGYAKLYLGKIFGGLSLASQILGFNIALLIFGGLGGFFLSILFGGAPFFWALAFFIIASLILFFENAEGIGFIDFILTIPLILIVLYIAFLSFGKGSVANIALFGQDRFFSFGVFMFALAGLAAIADAKEVLSGNSFGAPAKLKSAIILGTTIPLILYCVFIFGVLMASGGKVSKDAISGLIGVLGPGILKVGAVLGLLSLARSYLALGFDLKAMYKFDLKFPTFFAWLLGGLIPVLFYIFGVQDFIKLTSIMGGTLIAFDGIIIIFILRKFRKNIGEKTKLLYFGAPLQFFLIFILSAAIVYEFIYQIL